MVMSIIAILLILTGLIMVVLYPFYIGKPQAPLVFSYTGWIVNLILWSMITAVCGRVLGWW